MMHQIIQTGLLLSLLLMVPGAVKDVIDPPIWFKAFVVFAGTSGLVLAFLGVLVLIWQ